MSYFCSLHQLFHNFRTKILENLNLPLRNLRSFFFEAKAPSSVPLQKNCHAKQISSKLKQFKYVFI